MNKRDVSLTPRIENVREMPATLAEHFELCEIKQHFDESLNTIVSQFCVAADLNRDGDDDAEKTIYRSQIVFLEGILDFYMHEMSKYGLYKIFLGEWSKTEKYKKVMVSMPYVEKALDNPQSKEWFFDCVNGLYATTVMQDWETIRDQLNLIGIKFNEVCKAVYPELDQSHAGDQCKDKLIKLYKRRNQIAHQNDRSHLSAVQSNIDKEYVDDAIEFVRKFVDAIHNIAIDM